VALLELFGTDNIIEVYVKNCYKQINKPINYHEYKDPILKAEANKLSSLASATRLFLAMSNS